MIYQPIIGLEVHIQLKTRSKMFCGCSADIWQVKPNTHVCPVCLGLPGALPVPNQKSVELTQLMALAINCELAKESKFDRKNYFYPDLPKGYQISQYDQPLAVNGALKSRTLRTIRIRRVHLEEDTAKSIHQEGSTLVDFNKSGLPLMEIVTEPDLRSAEVTVELGRKIRQIAQWLDVSDADMEKGQMRIELNISMGQEAELNRPKIDVRRKMFELPKYKVEVKNINSFRFLKRIIDFEIERQTELLEKGQTPEQETRGWNEQGETTIQRFKETESDYRYFPEPDIPPLSYTDEYIDSLRQKLPVLPDALKDKFISAYNLTESMADRLLELRETANYFESLVSLGLDSRKAANLIVNRPEVRKRSPNQVISEIHKSKTEVLEKEEELKKTIQKVIEANPQAVRQYRVGKTAVLQFLIGQVMKETQGKASPQTTQAILKKLLV